MITRSKKNLGVSVPITNSKNILNWFVNEHQMLCWKEKRKSLMSDLRLELFNVFGKEDSTYVSEFRHKVWYLGFKGLEFIIYSAYGKGTSIDVFGLSFDQVRNGAYEKEIIEFLTELDNALKVKK